MSTIRQRLQLAGKDAATLASDNPVPLDRELVFETDTGLAKLGDGTTDWNTLPYLLGTAAAKDIGTSGASVPLLNGTNSWSAQQSFAVSPTAAGYQVAGTAVVGARRTGWTAATGTAQRSGFAAYSSPTISNPPTQAEVQAIADAVQDLARTLKALMDDLIAHGLIGS